MVNGGLAVEDYTGMSKNINPLLSEVLAGYPLNVTEGSEVDFNIIFFS
jgi:hypothetical protein